MKDLLGLLRGSADFVNLVNELRRREGLFSIIEPHLPQQLQSQGCQFGEFDGRILTLTFSNGSFATFLRYSSQSLKKSLQQYREFKDLIEIKGIVRPVTERMSKPAPPTTPRPLVFPDSLCDSFAELAADTDDAQLKAVLERFSQKRATQSEVTPPECVDGIEKPHK